MGIYLIVHNVNRYATVAIIALTWIQMPLTQSSIDLNLYQLGSLAKAALGRCYQ